MPVDAREFLQRLFSGRKVRKDAQIDRLDFPEPEEDAGPTSEFLRGVWQDITIHSKPGGMAYDDDSQQLFIRYPDGALYVYDQVSSFEATALLHADHKGGWVWDNLRIRGSLSGAQKPYALISSMKSVKVRKRATDKEMTEHQFPGWSPV